MRRSIRVLAIGIMLGGVAFAAAPPLVGVGAAADGHGPNRGYMDSKSKPCEDFFRYCNGAWYDTVSIPAAYTGVGAGREMTDRNQDILRQVLEETAARMNTEKDPTLKKLGAFYATLMDSARADREGAKPLGPFFERGDKVKTLADLQAEIGRLHADGISIPFALSALSDFKNSKQTIGILFQSGLGLPERDYYFRKDGKSDTLRQEYVAHITRIFGLLGVPQDKASADAKAILALETALAESSMARVQMRDPNSIYHKMTVAELQKLAPNMNWTAYFTALGVKPLTKPDATLNVAVPQFMRQTSALMASTPIETWRAYLKFHLTRSAAPWLGKAFNAEAFKFGSLISGAKEPLPRWKDAVSVVDGTMGEALGKAYVTRTFPPESKARVVELVGDLLAVMGERIDGLTWMSADTKTQAKRKLGSIYRKIGYPDQWRDYTALQVDAKSSAIENLRSASAFEARRQLSKVETPMDRNEWRMSPPTVNAYYSPFNNEIVFPAGILQPPQFDASADEALNYGGIGMVIGHEITHGFDDQGRKFDADGNLMEWWTSDDDKLFKERAQKVIDQYNGYVAVDTLHVNGQLTLGENIADLGGATLAYYAYQRYLTRHGRKDIDGFTPEQRFFIGFGQAWRRKLRPETERLRTLTDTHSPAFWRVNGPLSNMKEFREAFGCKDGDAMVRATEKRAEIW
ncbi:MAG TPA: M13 family metallopeptidase [Candidatus Eisenbacteria bacterium]|nr:M13 family metallopeptidase [Candidatus Eisenbacteria bacterium]